MSTAHGDGPGGDLNAVVRAGVSALEEAGVQSPRADVHLLLAHVLGVEVGEVARLAVLGRTLTASADERFTALLRERSARVPVQHLTGRAPFRRIELAVGPGVFVPRPETELLAGWAIARLADRDAPLCVDLCTGSGAVAFAIATEMPAVRVVGVELSAAALAWAGHNRDRIAPKVELRGGDAADDAVTGDLDGQVDVVVANPPYVPPHAVPNEPEVAEHDPALALYGLGPDGLQVPRLVAKRAAGLLRPGGWFGMEHADVQGDALLAHLVADGRWAEVADHRDHAGRPRYVTARRT